MDAATGSLTGHRFGSFAVGALIGTGGMGEVYRAHDTRLDRDVAIKVLPAITTDPDRLARFAREARVLAALNHPHIAQVYAVEDTDHGRAIVMELVDGSTLADHIARGPILLDAALAIARQIAEALEATHEKGIVHDRRGRSRAAAGNCWNGSLRTIFPRRPFGLLQRDYRS